MTKLDDEELHKIVSAARKARGGKPAKYMTLEKYADGIEKLINNNVQLPFILKWLVEENGEQLVLNTLRKFVVRKIGRECYEQYLARNGWQKTKKSSTTKVGNGNVAQASTATEATSNLGFDLNIPKQKTFKRTERN